MLILASGSPRRVDLMTQVGFEVLVRKPGTDERPKRGENPAQMVGRLAREKAHAVAAELEDSTFAVIISADTTVVAPNGRTVLGKPDNEEHARRMLKSLSGAKHTVLTGYCIMQCRTGLRIKEHVRVVKSLVRMRSLSSAEITEYIQTGEPMDKAGAYAAQGIGMSLIESLQGSYTNVVGLPMAQLVVDLKSRFGLSPDWSKLKTHGY